MILMHFQKKYDAIELSTVRAISPAADETITGIAIIIKDLIYLLWISIFFLYLYPCTLFALGNIIYCKTFPNKQPIASR